MTLLTDIGTDRFSPPLEGAGLLQIASSHLSTGAVESPSFEVSVYLKALATRFCPLIAPAPAAIAATPGALAAIPSAAGC